MKIACLSDVLMAVTITMESVIKVIIIIERGECKLLKYSQCFVILLILFISFDYFISKVLYN